MAAESRNSAVPLLVMVARVCHCWRLLLASMRRSEPVGTGMRTVMSPSVSREISGCRGDWLPTKEAAARMAAGKAKRRAAGCMRRGIPWQATGKSGLWASSVEALCIPLFRTPGIVDSAA